MANLLHVDVEQNKVKQNKISITSNKINLFSRYLIINMFETKKNFTI